MGRDDTFRSRSTVSLHLRRPRPAQRHVDVLLVEQLRLAVARVAARERLTLACKARAPSRPASLARATCRDDLQRDGTGGGVREVVVDDRASGGFVPAGNSGGRGMSVQLLRRTL